MAFNFESASKVIPAAGGAGYGLGAFIGDQFAGENRDAIRKILAELQAEAGPAQSAGSSAFGGITEDPAMRSDEVSSLNALRSIAEQKGMDASSRFALRQAQDATDQAERSHRGALVQQYAMRGMGGSGAELAAELANEQGAAQRGSMAGASAAADASQRALQAISGYGTMAGSIRGQDWNQAAQRAQAQDAMTRFNAGQANTMAQFNAGQRVTKAQMQTGFENQDAQRKRDTGGGIGSFLGAAGGAALGFL